MTMTRFAFLDAVSRLDDEILDTAAEQRKVLLRGLELRSAMGQDCRKKSAKRGGSGRKSPLRWIIPIVAAILLVGAMIPVGIYFIKRPDTPDPNPTPVSDVHLTAISGQTLAAAPADLSPAQAEQASASRAAQTARFGFLGGVENAGASAHFAPLASQTADPPSVWNDVASFEMPSIPQALVLFDENPYASVSIELDNPYDYYIADFYMICSEPGAQIFVDGRWIPLDGSTKIRWTGTTNRFTSYYVYLPQIRANADITITDMRYLNEKEVAVDLEKHNVANVYRIEQPVRTQFLVNREDGYYFRVIQSKDAFDVQVENAEPDSTLDPQYSDVYVLRQDGAAYTVKFSYTVPGTDVVGGGTITSPKIELLKITETNNGNVQLSYSGYSESSCRLDYVVLNTVASGTTFEPHHFNAYDNDQLSDDSFEIRIKGLKMPAHLVPYGYAFDVLETRGDIQLDDDSINSFPFKLIHHQEYDENGQLVKDWLEHVGCSEYETVEVYWNGYLIYSVKAYINIEPAEFVEHRPSDS